MSPIIIGAGLCGLTAAYRLNQQGHAVTVLEQSNHVGGVIQSHVTEGYQIETGPHTFLSTGQEIMALCQQLGIDPLPTSPCAKKRYVATPHGLCPVPSNPLELVTSPLLSLRGKLRLLAEPWQPRGDEKEESVASFTTRRLGPEVLNNLVAPFLSGVYAGDPERLSAASVFPKLTGWEQQSGSLLAGAWKAMKENKRSVRGKKSPYQLLSFPQGMGTLPQAIAQNLPPQSIRLNTPIQGIAQHGSQWQVTLRTGETLTTHHLILAVPAYQAAQWLHEVDVNLSETLQQIPYVPMAVVHLGIPKALIPHPLDGFGFLIPRHLSIPTLGCLWVSSLFPERAPEGHALLTAFLGGRCFPQVQQWTEANIVHQVTGDFQNILQAPDLTPTFSKVLRYEQAIPQYELGHGQRREFIETRVKDLPGLTLIGNYLQGVSLNDCVKMGDATGYYVHSI